MIIGWYDPRHMKKQMVALLIVNSLWFMAGTARAETVRTCSSIYGGGEFCGETTTTTTTVKHEVVETGANDNEMFTLLGSFALAALVATGLYKLTYKSYILG